MSVRGPFSTEAALPRDEADALKTTVGPLALMRTSRPCLRSPGANCLLNYAAVRVLGLRPLRDSELRARLL